MVEQPSVAYTTDAGLPVYDIRTAPDGKSNPHAYWWGMNYKALECEHDAVSRSLETHRPVMSQTEWDDFWTGFMYGHQNTLLQQA